MHVELILFLCLSVSLHELGHALAMRKYRIQMKEICLLGLGGPILFSFRLQKLFGETPITIRSFIFGGFVAPTYFGRLRVYCIEYAEAGHIYGGGIAFNFLLGALLFFTYALMEGSWETRTIGMMGFLFILGIQPKYTFRLYPLLGLMFLAFIFKSLMYNAANAGSSPLSFLDSIRQLAQKNNSLSEKLYLGGLISIALGIINCIPILPSDGGKIIERMLCGISYQYRKQILGIYKLMIIPVLLLVILVLLRGRA